MCESSSPEISLTELYQAWCDCRGNLPDQVISAMLEDMTYKQLYALSEPRRKERARTVSGPSINIDAYQDAAYYHFNFKSQPSTTGLRHHGYVRFKRPQLTSDRHAEDIACIVDCTCFEGSTQVLMEDGTYKAISKIRSGDHVITHKGRSRAVIGNVERRLNPDETVYSVGVTGFPGTMLVTGDHPFYALRGNKTCRCGCGTLLDATILNNKSCTTSHVLGRKLISGHGGNNRTRNEIITKILDLHRLPGGTLRYIAEQVGVSDSTVANVVNGKLKLFNQLDDEPLFDWVKVKDFHQHEWFLTPWIISGNNHLDSDIARFLGYYAAEGCIPTFGLGKKRNVISMSLHIDEKKTIGTDLQQIAETHLGAHFRLPRPVSGHQGAVVRITDCNNVSYSRPMNAFAITLCVTAEFRKFVEMHIGCGSWHKKLSAEFMSMDNDTLKQFIVGLFLGDGTVNNKKHIRWSSVSLDLVYQVSTILNRLHIRHNITDMNATWGVDICPGNSTRTVFDWLSPYYRDWQTRRRDGRDEQVNRTFDEGQLRSLHKCHKVDYHGTVWDLAVDEDESFVVNGVAVHNCPDFKYRFSWADKQRGASLVGPRSMNQAWNRAPRITNPTGRPGLCKHLLAVADYIFGHSVEFRGKYPEADSFNRTLDYMTKYAVRRWANPAQNQTQARASERQRANTRALRRRGVDPVDIVAPHAPDPGNAVPNADTLLNNPDQNPDLDTDRNTQ